MCIMHIYTIYIIKVTELTLTTPSYCTNCAKNITRNTAQLG